MLDLAADIVKDSSDMAFMADVIEASSEVPVICLLYTSPSPRDQRGSRMPSSA